MDKEAWKAAVEFVKHHWQQPIGLVVLLFLTGVVGLYLLAEIEFTSLSALKLVALAILLGVVVFLWLWANRLPRSPKDHLGFLIAICADKAEYQHKITYDFVATLRSLLLRSQSKYQYYVMELPNYHAAKIISQDIANRYRIRTRSRFMLYGRVRQRMLGGKVHHIFNLDGIVAHRGVPTPLSQALAQEFREVLPRDVKIHAEDDLLALEFTAEWASIVARYIIGIAAYFSLDLEYPQELFEDLRAKWKAEYDAVPVLRKIRQRLPTRLAEVYGSQASREHSRWWRTKEASNLAALKTHLDNLRGVDPTNYSGRLLMAIWHFAAKRDVGAAIAELRQCKDAGIKDGTWRYSYAFLLAYRGETQQAMKQYLAASRMPIGSKTVVDVEQFILRILEEEPERFQLHFCLGMVNLQGKDDKVRALEEFTAYVSQAKGKKGASKAAVSYAQHWASRLRRELGTEERRDEA